MRRWLFYFEIGWRDLVRLWPTTQHHVIIVAGICLPILMLLGLKRGHVESLRQDLITSPTGRQITFWSAQKGELLRRTTLDQLTRELPSVDVVIPETQRLVRLVSQVDEQSLEVDSVTLFATRKGDPLLSQLGINSPNPGAHEVILGQAVADQLKVKSGDPVDVVIARGRGEQSENATVKCQVSAIMPTDEHAASIGYADLNLLDQFDAYGRGFRVPDLGWASSRVAAADTYSGYLIFCETGNPLTENDHRFLADRGFITEECTDSPPLPIEDLLTQGFREKLIIYSARTALSRSGSRGRLRIAPSEISEATESDDIIIPWNEPCVRNVGDAPFMMVGLSMPRRTWLREYFRVPALAFDYEANPFTGHMGEGDHSAGVLKWPLDGKISFDLELPNAEPPAERNAPDNTNPIDSPNPSDGLPETQAVAPKTLVVPANLLSWVQQYGEGGVEYDPAIHLFVAKQEPSIYDRARLYARTIDDVPAVVTGLANRGFAVMSETGRITEIHNQDDSLQLLVWVVGVGVFLFGIVTVISVLMDSTDRKRVSIGILRVMGMSRSGVFISILLRAAAIGAAAALLSLLCGLALGLVLSWTPPIDQRWLSWKPIVSVAITRSDLVLVASGAMLCCGMGAIPPAWKASRLDPFDAIVEGRFR